MDAPKFSEELTSQSSLNPIQKYERFYALLRGIMSYFELYVSSQEKNFTHAHTSTLVEQ